ncbi:hypothetical protein [Caballeronia zhejiangensis]|nr:hypothetical protein [Caballeronia zhejiangensis]
MTKDDFFELIQEHKDCGGYVHQDTLAERLAELFAAGASEGQADFDEWFDREYPLDDLGRRSKYQSTNVLGLMQAAWNARDAEIAALRERIAGMEKDAERYRWLRGEGFDRPAHMWVTTLPAGKPIVHSDLDEAVDAAIAKEKEKQS